MASFKWKISNTLWPSIDVDFLFLFFLRFFEAAVCQVLFLMVSSAIRDIAYFLVQKRELYNTERFQRSRGTFYPCIIFYPSLLPSCFCFVFI